MCVCVYVYYYKHTHTYYILLSQMMLAVMNVYLISVLTVSCLTFLFTRQRQTFGVYQALRLTKMYHGNQIFCQNTLVTAFIFSTKTP